MVTHKILILAFLVRVQAGQFDLNDRSVERVREWGYEEIGNICQYV